MFPFTQEKRPIPFGFDVAGLFLGGLALVLMPGGLFLLLTPLAQKGSIASEWSLAETIPAGCALLAGSLALLAIHWVVHKRCQKWLRANQ